VISNLPSMSVVVPILYSRLNTLTPTNGSPLFSTTSPLSVLVCAAAPIAVMQTTSSKINFLVNALIR